MIQIGLMSHFKYPGKKSRTYSLAAEAKMKGVEFFIFSSHNVNIEKKLIKGETFEGNQWVQKVFSYPDVIINSMSPRNQEERRIEQQLRKEIPFTTNWIGRSKLEVFEKIGENEGLREYLIPYQLISSTFEILEQIEIYKYVVIKPISGRQGNEIYFIKQEGERYFFKEGKTEQNLSLEELMQTLSKLLNGNTYFIQPFKRFVTTEGNPYDIRVLVQKNGYGEWEFSFMYPRIGSKKGLISNLSQGGSISNINTFLKTEFPEKYEEIYEEIQHVSLDMAKHINSFFSESIDELGLDFSIDENLSLWLFEINTRPQTRFFQLERAKNTIAYAHYLATLKPKVNKLIKNNKISVGLLAGGTSVTPLKFACACVASAYNVNFFYFSPKDINYDEKTIKARFYENSKWVVRNVAYPTDIDVIYDRLRMKGRKGYTKVYKELQNITFTNELYGNSINKLELYNNFKQDGFLEKYLIPFQEVDNPEKVLDFLQQYNAVILKPRIGSFGRSIIFIHQLEEDSFEILIDANKKLYSMKGLREYLLQLIEKEVFIVQKFIYTRTKDDQPFDIRVHLMKDGKGNWSFVKVYPRIGIHYTRISATGDGGYIGAWKGFIMRNFGTEQFEKLDKDLRELSLNVANQFEKIYNKNLSEMGIDIAIDRDANLYFIEANVNKPGVIYYEFDLAKHAIPYAIYLAKKH